MCYDVTTLTTVHGFVFHRVRGLSSEVIGMSRRWHGVIGLLLGGVLAPGRGAAADGDGDGVPDELDVCPRTPPHIPVDAQGRPLADLDGDCEVNMSDANLFASCVSGALVVFLSGCEAADLDRDGDVDQIDFGLLQTGISGSATSNEPSISGRVLMVSTAGARPPIGPVGLRFNGSDGQPDYTVTTSVNGVYSVSVNDGWTGTVTAADPGRCVLFPASTAVSTPVTGPVSGLNLQAWVPPIGVPMPTFGIREQAPASPSPWTGTVAGFYYVDNTHSASTDASNPNGYPAKPRKTIPTDLPAGSVVEVRGGPYTYTIGGVIPLGGNGTAAQPVFIKGVSAPAR
ncbi:MAG: hypothetical protein HRF43_13185, partial [Phycisphaerae bacterium]